VRAYGLDLDKQLERLEKELREGSYRPRPARRKWIDKPGSDKKRPLGIPTVRDRVVETALKHVLEPIFEHGFSENSHGFRPGRSCKSALAQVDGLLEEGKHVVLEVDIQGFFDHIDHGKLLGLVSEKVSDGRVLALIRLMLERGVLDEDRLYETEESTPQGGVVSPLLANI
jgi:RNA-directed DNA polymerase